MERVVGIDHRHGKIHLCSVENSVIFVYTVIDFESTQVIDIRKIAHVVIRI